MTNHDRKQILARFIQEVWNEGNAAAADKYVAECYTIHHDPGDKWHGQTLDLEAFKDRVNTSRGPFPASGKRVTMSGITVYYFEGERISGHWQAVDRLGVFQQLSGR